MPTAYQDPASDHGTNQWTRAGSPPPASHYACINDGVRSPSTSGANSSFLYASGASGLHEQFGLTASPAGVGTVTAIKVWCFGSAQGPPGADIQANVYIAGAWLGAQNLGVYNNSTSMYGSASWSGSWTKAQVDAAIVDYGTNGPYDYELDWGYVELTYSSGAATLSPGNLAQSQSVGAATISQVHVLSAAALSAAQLLGAGQLSQLHVLGAPGACGAEALLHGQSLAAAAVTQAHVLSPDGLSQGQWPEADIALFHLLTPDGIRQSQSLEAALLLGIHALSPDDLVQAQTLEAAALGAQSVGRVAAQIAAAGQAVALGPLLLSAGLADAGTPAFVGDPRADVSVSLPSLTVRIDHA